MSKATPPTTLPADIGNAELLIQWHKKDIRFCPGRGWLVWDGKRWQQDESGQIMEKAKETAKRLYRGKE